MSDKPEANLQSPDWSDVDMVALRTFIRAVPNFMAYLAERRPVIDTSSFASAALTGAKHAGYEEIFRVLQGMTQEQPAEKSAYISND